MTIFNLSAVPAATFDDTTGQLTINCTNAAYVGIIPEFPTNEEEISNGLLLAIEAAAANKRTNLNAAVSDGDAFSVPSPQYQFVSRSNADGTASEVQIEYTPNIRLWFKDAGAIAAANAVNDAD